MSQDDYELWLSDAAVDPQWDRFVESAFDGHHVQTAGWANVKALLGWKAARVVASERGTPVGGAQLLLREIPVFGAVGYVPKGPIAAKDDAALRSRLIDAVTELADSRRVRHLTVQPPNHGHDFVPLLTARDFAVSSVPVAPAVSLMIDLSPSIDEIMAQLSRKTRYNVRVGQRKGIKVREGDAGDLTTYHTMLATTAKRQGFGLYPIRYFQAMWQHLHPTGHLKLFIAEHEGEVVAGQLIVPFGETVINKLSVWSGLHGDKRPNEALQWNSIEWSKANGYRYYDFEGINRAAAEALRRNEPIPEELKQTVTSFKVGFGGAPVVFPEAYYFVRSSLVRFGYESVLPRVADSPLMEKVVGALRFGGGRVG